MSQDDANMYEDLQENWPAQRPTRKRPAKRAYRRKNQGRLFIRSERLDPPDIARLSRALLAAQREIAAREAARKGTAEHRNLRGKDAL